MLNGDGKYEKLRKTISVGNLKFLPLGSKVYKRLLLNSFEVELISGVTDAAAHVNGGDDSDRLENGSSKCEEKTILALVCVHFIYEKYQFLFVNGVFVLRHLFCSFSAAIVPCD